MTDSSLAPQFAQRFSLTLSGKGAHAARPHEGLDSIVTGSHIIAALATLTVTRGSPPAGVSVTRFHSGNSWNVLPPETQIDGVLHAHEAAVQQQLSAQVSTLVKTMAQAFGVQAELTWQPLSAGEAQNDAWFSSL